MNLLNLPQLPLFKIARFLDEDSLVKLQQSSRSMCCFLKNRRYRLVERKGSRIWRVRMRRIEELSTEMPTYSVNIERFFGRGTMKNFIYSTKNDVFHSPPLEWLALTFSNTRIIELHLEKMHLHEEEMGEIDRLMRQSKLKFDRIVLEDPALSSDTADGIVKFAKCVTPNLIVFWEREGEKPGEFLKDTFLEVLSALPDVGFEDVFRDTETKVNEYEVVQLHEFPASIERIPSVFTISGVFTIEFQHFKRLIHDWYDSKEMKIKWWNFTIVGVLEKEEMGKRLALPFSYENNGPIFISSPFYHQIRIVRGRYNLTCSTYEWYIRDHILH